MSYTFRVKHFYTYALYAVTPDGAESPFYVGKGHDDTDSGYSRLAYYLSDHLPKGVTKNVRAFILKLRESGATVTGRKLFESLDEHEAFAQERVFVAKFGRENLINSTSGGCCGTTLDASSRKKMSEARLGKKLGPQSEEHRKKLSEAARVRAADPEWRADHSARMMGRKPSADTIARVKEALTGKPHPNRFAWARRKQELADKQKLVVGPLVDAGFSVAEIFEQVREQLNLKHLSAVYRILERCNLTMPGKVNFAGMTAEEKHQRRLDQYKQSYQNHREERIQKATARAKAAEAAIPDTAGQAHQKAIRDKFLAEDLAVFTSLSLKPPERATEFDLTMEPFSSEHRDFVERYEWLGTAGFGIRWCFTARFKGALGGVVLMSETYSRDRDATKAAQECLIQRGCCAGWTPKNVASRLIMFGCRWMVDNTEKRVFYGYADPRAGEIGTIYQACNFLYLGEFAKKLSFGADGRVRSMQSLKRTSAMVPWLKKQGIVLPPECFTGKGYLRWSAIPLEIKQKMREHIKSKAEGFTTVLTKHGKYALRLGRDRSDHKAVVRAFEFSGQPYPKRAAHVVTPECLTASAPPA